MTLGRLGIIGYGNMGAAITGGIVDAGLFAESDIHVFDLDREKLARARTAGHFIHATAGELSESSDIVLVAVKPKDVAEALKAISGMSPGVLVISVAAGIPLKVLESYLPGRPVIRVMPNAPSMVGAGVSVLARGSKAESEHVDAASKIMGATGFVSELPESLMDAVTGLSGSGPAYVALAIDALSDGGVKMGLPRDVALKLAAQTVYGSARMILKKGLHPMGLRDMVTSPGGTTIEGVTVLEKRGVRAAFIEAVEAATKKSKELGS